MAQEKSERKGHPVRNTAVAAAVLALLLGGGRYGLGLGRGGGEGVLPGEGEGVLPETAQTETLESPEAAEEPEPADETPADDGVLEITVRESTLLYEGVETDLAGLSEALLRDYHEGVTVKLTDDHAIKSAYDEAAALLSSLGIDAAP